MTVVYHQPDAAAVFVAILIATVPWLLWALARDLEEHRGGP